MQRFSPELASYAIEHVWLVLISVLLAAAVAIPSAVLLTRKRTGRRLALGFANIVQTVPSLALFGFLIPVPVLGGIGRRTAILALVLYALLPMLRNTMTGILAVDAAVRESAVAMGMTGRQVLLQVEMPLAAPTIMAGIRIAVVTTIGTATIAAAIGAGGLGVFIFRGIAMVDSAQILAGAVPAAVMALAADEGLGWIERKLSRS
jgi:osmoprotectant transport system permease protein